MTDNDAQWAMLVVVFFVLGIAAGYLLHWWIALNG